MMESKVANDLPKSEKLKKKKLKGNIKKETNQEGIISKPKKSKKSKQIKLKGEEDATLIKPTLGKKQKNLGGIPDLEDAKFAGTDHSLECTLIVAVGESAKTSAVAGLEVVGRNTFGVYPIKRKIANVRDAPKENQSTEIMDIIKILGLESGKKYQSMNDLKTLRYGKFMIMADHDPDGSFSKGLLINVLHFHCPSLIQFPFVEEFITPIAKATKGDEVLSFFSLSEFEDWKSNIDDSSAYKIKFYKGLGTFTSKEIKECFRDLQRHTISFFYRDTSDDTSIEMAFSKKHTEQRKKELSQLTRSSEELETWLPAHCIYGRDTTSISFSDFIHKEWMTFSYASAEKFLPNIMDGLRVVQRKVLFTCLKRNVVEEVAVVQLAGSVLENSAHLDGEQMLLSAITNMAHNYVGSNNINLLVPIGQFGSRLQGGKDAASAQYLFTKLSPLARYIYHPHDDFLLTYRTQNGLQIEPVCYFPVIPMVLVNGANCAGLGSSSVIPNYNPRDIVDNLRRMLDGEDPVPMAPWYKNFKGTVKRTGTGSQLMMFGECALLGQGSLEITELPIGTWTSNYKEKVLNHMLLNDSISGVCDFTTDTTVRFVVAMTDEKLKEAEESGLHKTFHLHNKTTPIWSGFDAKCQLKTYDDEIGILKDFFSVRLEYYVKRKSHLEGLLQAECSKLSNQARFIDERCSGKLVVEGKSKKAVVKELLQTSYNPDPVRTWKLRPGGDEKVEEDEEDSQIADRGTKDMFDYLLDMPLCSFTKKRRKEILAEHNEKLQELEDLKIKDPSSLWRDDLDEFLKKLDEVEALEFDTGGNTDEINVQESKPTKCGQRVNPLLDESNYVEEKKMKKFKKKKNGRLQPVNGLGSPGQSNHDLHAKRKDPDTFKPKYKKQKMAYQNGDFND